MVIRWWKYAVLRGNNIPVRLDGMWFDLTETDAPFPLIEGAGMTLEATNRWEQREDGEVAVVYEWFGRKES